MAIAKLSIDLEARLAGLQQGLDKAGRLAEQQSARMSRAFEGARTAALAVSGALGGLFTVGAATAFIRQTGEAADAITNLSRVAGTSAEDFQRYAFAARTVGIEQDKLSDILKDVQDKVGDFLQTGGGPLADFFEKIAPKVGVTADQFRRLGGADALQLYVSSLEKANLTQSELTFYLEAIASDAALLLPLLQDNGRAMGELGDKAERLGLVLDAKAIAAATEFNRNLRELEENATAVGRVLSGPVITALNNVVTRIAAARNTFESFSEFVRIGLGAEAFTDASEGFGFYTRRVQELRVELERLKASGGLIDSLQISGTQRQLADAEKLLAFYREAVRLNPAALPQASYSNEGRNAIVPALPLPRSPAPARQRSTGGATDTAISVPLRPFDPADFLLPDLGDAAETVAVELVRARTPAEELAQSFRRIQDAALDVDLQPLQKDIKRADTFANELGLTFSSAFEDAIVAGKNLRDVIQGLADDILRLVTRELVTKPLADSITGILKGVIGGGGGGGGGSGGGGGLAGLFGSLFGGFFADGGYLPPGRWGIAGERGPEPIFGGRTGLTVRPSGGPVSVVNHFALSGPVDRRTQQQIAAEVGMSVQRAMGRNA